MAYTEFEQLVMEYDCLMFQETKCDDGDLEILKNYFENLGYNVYTKHRAMLSRHKSGGLAICVKKKWSEYIKYHETKSRLVMWLKVKNRCCECKELLIGNVYIPPVSSPYSDVECFNEVETELDYLRLDNSIQVCLTGDLNARVGEKNEFLSLEEFDYDDYVIDPNLYSKLDKEREMLTRGIPLNRVTMDKTVEVHGNRLLEMCKTRNLYICNGRVGLDATLGKVTSKGVSTVDYVIGSPEVLYRIDQFHVIDFDPLFSDIHSGLHTHLIMCTNTAKPRSVKAPDRYGIRPLCNDNHEIHWDSTKVTEFQMAINTDALTDSISALEGSDQKTNVNETCNLITGTLLNAAKRVFKVTCVTCAAQKSQNNCKRNIKKPWFDTNCAEQRKLYRRAKNRYRQTKGLEELAAMKNANKAYKRQVKTSINKHKRSEINKIRKLRSENPKEYWKILNDRKPNKDIKVTLGELTKHFEELNKEINVGEENLPNVNIEINNVLNRDISQDEIIKMASKLNNGKAGGEDGLLNEYIKSTMGSLAPYYSKLFNMILKTGVVPTSWTTGKIVPIYKNKGDETDPTNYRGITLLSCLGKLFTSIINARLKEVVDINENQAGFRESYSTLDHIFLLKSAIEICHSQKKKLYCAFVDYSKAFDTVWRAGLWHKLLKAGVTGNVFRVIQNMYGNARSCVSVSGKVSSYFSSHIGVRQGENLSPMLFALYVNDLEKYLLEKGCTPVKFGDDHLNEILNLIVLMYADDTIVISDSPQGLQKSLDCLRDYCNLWKLKVNETKTKVMIFSKRKVKTDLRFTFDGKELERVDHFKYLGVTFSYYGRFTECKKTLQRQAQRAMFGIIQKARAKSLPVDVQINLFDTMVVPILTYGCEVWGNENVELANKLQYKFYRYILHLKTSTPICMLLGELGKLPVECVIRNKIINFWANIIEHPHHRLTRRMYSILFEMHSQNMYSSPWLTCTEALLNNSGLSYVWQEQCTHGSNWLKNTVKQSIHDQFIQGWRSDINTMSKCITYRLFKQTFELEDYFKILPSRLYISLCKFRTSNHRLPIEAGRYRRIPRAERICNKCNQNALGDEFHFMFKCSALLTLRKKYIPRYFIERPNVLKMDQLFSSKNEKTLSNLCLYIQKATKVN